GASLRQRGCRNRLQQRFRDQACSARLCNPHVAWRLSDRRLAARFFFERFTAMPGDEMTLVLRGLRLVLVMGMALGLGGLAGCGDDAAGSSSTGTIDRSNPTIAGIPETTAVAGQPYSFAPKVANTTGTAKFTIKNQPTWAKFDSSTGTLTGTPQTAQVGKY